jgi:hypothetical protein
MLVHTPPSPIWSHRGMSDLKPLPLTGEYPFARSGTTAS